MKKNKKEIILYCAARCFADMGFERSSIELIARNAGVALGLVRYYFANKERLYFEAAAFVMNSLKGHLVSQRNENDSSGEAVRRFILAYMNFTSDPENAYGIIYQESPFKVLRDPQFAEEIGKVSIQILEVLRDILATKLSPDQAMKNATLIVASLHGIQRARLSPKLREFISFEHVADFFSGIEPYLGESSENHHSQQFLRERQ